MQALNFFKGKMIAGALGITGIAAGAITIFYLTTERLQKNKSVSFEPDNSDNTIFNPSFEIPLCTDVSRMVSSTNTTDLESYNISTIHCIIMIVESLLNIRLNMIKKNVNTI